MSYFTTISIPLVAPKLPAYFPAQFTTIHATIVMAIVTTYNASLCPPNDDAINATFSPTHRSAIFESIMFFPPHVPHLNLVTSPVCSRACVRRLSLHHSLRCSLLHCRVPNRAASRRCNHLFSLALVHRFNHRIFPPHNRRDCQQGSPRRVLQISPRNSLPLVHRYNHHHVQRCNLVLNQARNRLLSRRCILPPNPRHVHRCSRQSVRQAIHRFNPVLAHRVSRHLSHLTNPQVVLASSQVNSHRCVRLHNLHAYPPGSQHRCHRCSRPCSLALVHPCNRYRCHPCSQVNNPAHDHP